MTLAAAVGWAAVLCLGLVALELRRRLELVARAEHELRSPATALGLAMESLARDPAAAAHASSLELELARMRAGLADLGAARHGQRAAPRPEPLELERLARAAIAGRASELAGRDARVRWEAGRARTRADGGRVAQALGNLVANAAEHGSGPVALAGRREGRRIEIEVRNAAGRTAPAAARERGRGLRIASAAARDAGGRLSLDEEGDQVVARLELPGEDLPPAA